MEAVRPKQKSKGKKKSAKSTQEGSWPFASVGLRLCCMKSGRGHCSDYILAAHFVVISN